MHRIRHLLAASATALALVGCEAAPDQLSIRDDAILGGTPAAEGQFPHVVALVSQGLCTGTLVAPDIVLTAAHCVHPGTLGLGSQAEVTASTRVVLDDLNLTQGAGGRQIAAADTVHIASFGSPGDPDIGLVFLAEDVTDREPAVINPDTAAFGDLPVDLVGFGRTSTGAFAQLMYALGKPQTTCEPYGIDGSQFICLDQTSGAGICSGDSGGPAFATIAGRSRLVGITSFGEQSCTQFGAQFRTDSAPARDFLQTSAPELLCRDDGVCDVLCGAAAPDPDCAGLGDPCETASECASGMCVTQGDDQLCADPCTAGENACPGGFACTPIDDGGEVCWPSEESGSCSAGGGGGSGTGLLLLGVLVVMVRRRAG